MHRHTTSKTLHSAEPRLLYILSGLSSGTIKKCFIKLVEMSVNLEEVGWGGVGGWRNLKSLRKVTGNLKINGHSHCGL